MVSIALFVVPFGIAFGAAASESGVTAVQTILMSVLVFSAAAQFSAIEYWATPVPIASLLFTILALNARHIIMGATLSRWLNNLPQPQRTFSLSLLSDPNYADTYLAFKTGERDAGVLVGGGFILWAAWITGTAIGALAGARLGQLDRFGIDVLMICFFTSLVVGSSRQQLVPRQPILPIAIIAAVVAIGSQPALPTGWQIVAAAISGGVGGLLLYSRSAPNG